MLPQRELRGLGVRVRAVAALLRVFSLGVLEPPGTKDATQKPDPRQRLPKAKSSQVFKKAKIYLPS